MLNLQKLLNFQRRMFQTEVDRKSFSTSPFFFPELNSCILLQGASLLAQMVKNLPAMQEAWVLSLGWEDPMDENMGTHSNILAWRIPWREEPGGVQSTGWQRVGHDWATKPSIAHLTIELSTCCWWSWRCFNKIGWWFIWMTVIRIFYTKIVFRSKIPWSPLTEAFSIWDWLFKFLRLMLFWEPKYLLKTSLWTGKAD